MRELLATRRLEGVLQVELRRVKGSAFEVVEMPRR